MALGQKQFIGDEYWLEALNTIHHKISKRELDNLIDASVEEIKRTTRNKKVAYGWSGGKDSQVLRGLCELAGIHDCLLGISELEYPAFLQWTTDNMPWELEVINSGMDLFWLKDNQHMLFPQDATTAAKWFKKIQHEAQDKYFRKHSLDMLLLGRRKKDGNHTGRGNLYTNKKGIVRYSPIAEWTHEEVFAYIYYYKVSLPPNYSWLKGYRVGTGAWAARQHTGSIMNGWQEVFDIDSSIVYEASKYLPSAQQFLNGRAK